MNPTPSMLRICAALAPLVLLASAALAAPDTADQQRIPPVPEHAKLPLPDNLRVAVDHDGALTWLAVRPLQHPHRDVPSGCEAQELYRARWFPATGAVEQRPMNPLRPSLSGPVLAQLRLAGGLLAVAARECQPDAPNAWRLVWSPSDGSLARKLDTDVVLDPQHIELLAIDSHRAALVTRDPRTRHVKVYAVQGNDHGVKIKALPTLRATYNRDFASAMAGRDHVMVLGGSDGPLRGCSPCRAETHYVNLDTGQWHPGPPLLEARSGLAASTLADGSIVVTGGWTPASGWREGPSRTAERWNPHTQRFEPLPPMPEATARHQHIEWRAPWGETLLLAVKGTAASAQALDTRTWSWRVIGEWASGSEQGGCGFYPFVRDGNAYAWLVNREEYSHARQTCSNQDSARLSLLRPPAGAPATAQAPPEDSLVSYLYRAAFVPAEGSAPAVLIGGSRHAGLDPETCSGAVESVDSHGRVATLPSLNTAREGARAFRVAGGILVMGGRDSCHSSKDRKSRPLPAEWLPPPGMAPWKWLDVQGRSPDAPGPVAQQADGSLLALDESGRLEQFKLVLRAGIPTLESSPWPSLNRARRLNADTGDNVTLHPLHDGRVVVAGGAVLTERVALKSDHAGTPGPPDTYLGTGGFLPWRRYEIFDPARGQWVNSAPSRRAGGRAVVLPDGRVIKISPPENSTSSEALFELEISTRTGSAWSRFATPGSRLLLNDSYRILSLQGELFAIGEVRGERPRGGPHGVEWLNPATARWELVWKAGPADQWRDRVGRIVRRTVVGAHGQAKTVLIPVEGRE